MQLDPIFLQNYLDAIERQNTQYYGKGGKVVDFLAEVLKGESKKATKEAPAASRRKVLGLDPKTVPPGQVAVKETVTKAPKKGETSVTLEEIANIPMSRRDVMRLSAGQLGRGLIPQGALRSAMELVGEAPVGAIEQVVKQAKPLEPLTVPGLIARGLREGLSNKAIEKLIKKELNEEVEDWVIPNMRRPESVWDFDDIQEAAQGPLHYFTSLIDKNYQPGPDIRKAMREIREANPDLYERLKETARDTDMSVAEMMPQWSFEARLQAAQDMAKKGGYPFDVQKFLERYEYDTDNIEDTLREFGYSLQDFK